MRTHFRSAFWIMGWLVIGAQTASAAINTGMFVSCMSGPAAGVAAGCSIFDFHPDGHVDLRDAALLQRNFLLSPGAINSCEETTGTVSVAGEIDEYTFTGVNGTTVTVDFFTPTVNNRPDLMVRLDLVRPNGAVAATMPSCANTIRLDNIAIDANGLWKVRVKVYESWASCGYGADTELQTGQYTLTVCPSNKPPIPLVYGQTRKNVFTADCAIVNFSFTGTSGDVVSAHYNGPTSARRVRMFNPAGAEIGTSGPGTAVGVFDELLLDNGVYRVSAEALDGSTVGTFGMNLSELDDAVPIAFNTPVDTAISQIAEVDIYAFAGVTGSFVTVDHSTPTVNGRPDHMVRLDLVRPDGTTAATIPSCSNTIRLDNIAVNQTGTWTVRVRIYESWATCGYGLDTALLTGAYTLSVCNSNGTPIPIAYGQTLASVFTADCQFVNFSFTGTSGDVVSAHYNGPTSARRVRMFNPAGAEIGTSGPGTAVGVFDELLLDNGVYRVSAEALDGSTVGTFGMNLSELDDAVPIAFNTPVDTAISQIAEVDIYAFAGVTGSFVTVDHSTPTVNGRPDHMVRLDLVRPDGTTAATIPSCSNTIRLDNIAVNQTGTWTVRVRIYESWATCGYGLDTALLTGAYTLSVCNSNGTPIPIAYGQTLASVFTADCQFVNFSFTGTSGDVVSAHYNGPTSARRVRMFNPAGAEIGTSGPGTAVGVFDELLLDNGVYRVSAEALDGSTVGTFGMNLSELDDAVPIAFNTPVDTAISQIAEVDIYAFAGVTGSFVTVDHSTPTVNGRPDHMVRLDLVRPDGTTAATIPSCSNTIRLDNIAVNQTGTWTVRVRIYESWATCGYGLDTALLTGAYTLSVCNSNGTPIPIAYGQTLASVFTADCQFVNFSFTGTSGDVVSAHYNGPTSARRVRMFNPAGAEIGTSGPGTAVGVFDELLLDNGVYRVSAEALDGSTVGTFGMNLSELDDAVPIAFNTPVDTAISQIAEVDIYAFAGVTGSFVTVDHSTPTVNGRPDHMVRLDLVRPDGTTAATIPSCSNTIRLDNIAVNQTGTWTVRVRIYESWATCGYGLDTALLTGAYTLSVCNSNGTPIPIAYGTPHSGTLDVDCEIEAFTFNGLAGDAVTAMYLGVPSARRVQLFSPMGTVLATSAAGQGAVINDALLAANGVYRLSVEAADGQPSGAFHLGIDELSAASPITLNTNTPSMLSPAADMDFYEFSGTSGSTISVRVTTPTVNSRPDVMARVELVRPNASVLSSTPSCGFSADIVNAVLDATGTWTVRVRPYESWATCGYGADTALWTGNYTVRVCSGACP